MYTTKRFGDISIRITNEGIIIHDIRYCIISMIQMICRYINRSISALIAFLSDFYKEVKGK